MALALAQDDVDDGGHRHPAGRPVLLEEPRYLGAIGRVAQDGGAAGEDRHDDAVEEARGMAQGARA